MRSREDVESELRAFLSRGLGRAQSVVYVLMDTVRQSSAGTVMEVERELRDTAQILKDVLQGTTMDVRAALETFLSSVGTSGLAGQDFESVKRRLIAAGEAYLVRADKSRERIALHAEKLVEDGSTILTISTSRAVAAILEAVVAPPNSKSIKVYVAESRPDSSGFEMANRLRKLNISVTVLPDAAIGPIMEQVDVVLVGAEAAMENGGIVNKIGTFQLAVTARAFNKPLYVAVESYKFSHLYPFNQKDLLSLMGSVSTPLAPPRPELALECEVDYFNPPADLTPPEYITLLFTDEGVLTPAAVSEMLMRAVLTEG
mmetsp:Transcript_12226/g.37295  ORF Transcript_12226/g.37295 Transcript_12226/m.37295 type:complete len:316 (-) Transcript_12226:476-1423(-)